MFLNASIKFTNEGRLAALLSFGAHLSESCSEAFHVYKSFRVHFCCLVPHFEEETIVKFFSNVGKD